MLRIKVCGMCDPFNVKEIAKTKPDYIGFIFYPGSPRYVGAEPDKSLFLNVPSGIARAGVFVNEDPDRILDLTLMAGLGLIQLHGNESADYCIHLKSKEVKIIKAFNIADDFDFESTRPYLNGCDYFLFDTKTEKAGGSGKKFNWDKLTGYSLEKPFFLGGGVGPDDAAAIKAIENRAFFALDINSCFETAPGIKNAALVKTFIDEVKNSQV